MKIVSNKMNKQNLNNISKPKQLRIKEFFKDIKNKRIFENEAKNYDFCYVHPTKAAGSFLVRSFSNFKNVKVLHRAHEIKINHLALKSKILISVRDPITRFESSFYSVLHKRKDKLEYNLLKFYSKYHDVNKYIDDLKRDPKHTIQYSCLHNDHMGRFLSYDYWIKDLLTIKKYSDSIFFVFRQEHMESDVSLFLKKIDCSQDITKNIQKFDKPKNKYPIINSDNIEFLKNFLENDYALVNCLLKAKGLSTYTNLI
ncbi:hypothetical protein [Synechococcus sp. ROS8604]|uniref:hypothetical protein n=1 Tax=Synechococcus sp. ROS8604 TaxID=1442557 RepID=UPI001647E3FB|nr:hypothetical protein [Synechococcus sp. ROS8604]QNI86954.1 sulfotransferase family protein [Synechococcus sp. ROS8604]